MKYRLRRKRQSWIEREAARITMLDQNELLNDREIALIQAWLAERRGFPIPDEDRPRGRRRA